MSNFKEFLAYTQQELISSGLKVKNYGFWEYTKLCLLSFVLIVTFPIYLVFSLIGLPCQFVHEQWNKFKMKIFSKWIMIGMMKKLKGM